MTARTIAAARRHAEAVRLKAEGLHYRQIAAQMNISVSTAHDYVLKAIAAVPVEAVHELRAIESDRLNAIIADLWKIARDDDTDVATRIQAYRELRQNSESLRRMFGVDAPVRQTLTVFNEDLFDAEIRRLNELVAEQQQPNAEAPR